MPLDEIIESSLGMFHRCDLHIHTKFSRDFANKRHTFKDIINKCLEKRLDVIAITDHNTVGNIGGLRELGKKNNVSVLPGVEVTVRDDKTGIHVLGIFDEAVDRIEINDLLHRIGIPEDGRGREEVVTDCYLDKVSAEIRSLNGLVVAAHADTTNGVIKDTKIDSVEAGKISRLFDALEITDFSTREHFDVSNPTYGVRIPCIVSSDAHSLIEIGTSITLLKMDEDSVEGIKQALVSEIRLEKDKKTLRDYYW